MNLSVRHLNCPLAFYFSNERLREAKTPERVARKRGDPRNEYTLNLLITITGVRKKCKIFL